MLESLVIHNSFISDVYIEDIYGMKFQIHDIHPDQYFIQPQHDQNLIHLYYNHCVYNSVDI